MKGIFITVIVICMMLIASIAWSEIDANQDGVVDILDLVLVGKHFGENPPTDLRADINRDGTVDIGDLVLVGKHFGEKNDGAEMVLIPAGEFSMGPNYEMPAHTVYLDAYYIDKYEVTNAQYATFLNEYGKNEDAAGHKLLAIDGSDCLIEKVGGTYQPKSGYENHPVIQVSWYGAGAYAQFYGKRLPTEAQWEKAARGGLVGKEYPWGDSNPDGSNANFADKNTDYLWSDKTIDDGYERTAPVGSYVPNGYGLYDMAGNVWEWCADRYSSAYYSVSPKDNPLGPGPPIFFVNDDFTKVRQWCVLRGGSWYSPTFHLRCTDRFNSPPWSPPFNVDGFGIVGFRCAQDL